MPKEYQYGEAFQQKLLAMYVREPQATQGVIEPAYFSNPMHVDIARLTKEIYAKHKYSEVKLSRATLLAIVKGYLGKKRRDIWPGYRKVVKDLFTEKLRDRAVVLTQALGFAKIEKFRKALVDAEKDVNAGKFGYAIQRFDKLKDFGTETDLGVEYWNDPTDPSRWIEDRRKIVSTFYIPTLDDAMEGGLGAGELGIILGGGKVGKTTMLGRFAGGALWQGKNVAIATGELSASKYRKRIDAMVTATPTWKLTQLAKVDDEKSEMMKKLQRVQNRMLQARGHMKGSLWIKQWPTGKGRVSDISLWLDKLAQNGCEIDILFVDYIRTFRPDDRFDEHRLSIGQVCMDLRGLAIEKDIPVWTASQTNRAALSKERIGPEDFAEDISQFWTLDFLIALCQTKAEENLKPQQGRLYLTAARDVGRGAIVEVKIDRNTFRVWEKSGNRKRERK